MYELFYAGWMAWLPVVSSTRESTNGFQKCKKSNYACMHVMYLFFVDDSKILHFTSPVAIVITPSELRPEIVGTCDNAHTDNQT